MKFFLIAICCVASVAIINATTCHGDDISNCDKEHCDDNWEVGCSKGFCTCISSRCGYHETDCNQQGFCATHAKNHNCTCKDDWHCIDQWCSCGYHFGPGDRQPTGGKDHPIID